MRLPAAILALFSLTHAGVVLSQPPSPPPAIAKVAAQAAAAREAGRLDDALRLYRQALAAAPRWQEGWWQTGTIYYGRDQYVQCRDAFRRFTALETKLSAGFAFLGLCEFQTRELPQSLQHLEKAVSLGLPGGEQLTEVVLYHLAVLHTRGGNFERALQFCAMLAKKGEPDPKLVAVAGIAAMRRPIFPHELPDADRDLAFQLGSVLLSLGVRPAEEVMERFESILRQYPKAPNVHYTYATFLLVNVPDKGLEMLKQELEISPDHLPALISLAFEYQKRSEPATARPFAERAAKIAPDSFAARACLGRVLLDMDDRDLPAAVAELEAAARLAPDSPQVHFSLASAYSRMGRKADAARERAEFARLKARSDGGSGGGAQSPR